MPEAQLLPEQEEQPWLEQEVQETGEPELAEPQASDARVLEPPVWLELQVGRQSVLLDGMELWMPEAPEHQGSYAWATEPPLACPQSWEQLFQGFQMPERPVRRESYGRGLAIPACLQSLDHQGRKLL